MKTALRIILASATVLTAPFETFAGTPTEITLPAGDSAFRGTRLTPYENVWLYTAKLPSGEIKVQGLWTDHLDRLTREGRTLMRRVQGMTYLTGVTSSQINVFDPATMLPVSSELHKFDGSWLKRTFNDALVTETRGASPADRDGTTTTASFPTAVLDYWGGMYGVLLASLPLHVGDKGTLPSLDEFDPLFKPASFEVLREEDIQAGSSGKVHARVVKADSITYWIAERAPFIIRVTIEMDRGVVAQYDKL